MNDLRKNLTVVHNEIHEACAKANRPEEALTLIAVSKGHNFSAIKEAYSLGLRDFGENYAQELSLKIALAHDAQMNDITWHYLGAVQSNKINIIKNADVIHSMSSVRHAALLDTHLSSSKKIFVQVNLDGDVKRQGFAIEEVLTAISQISRYKNLEIVGLMTVAPQDDKPRRYWLEKMSFLREEILKSGLVTNLKLSMGMSDDFSVAIACGADYLRIGTKIFGERRSG